MPPSSSTAPALPANPLSGNRWLQLFVGVVCMVMIANLQYGWTLFVQPIDQKFGWGRPAIQVAFSIFVITEAWLVPLEGWFVDRFGPRLIVAAGGLLVGAAWIINSLANSLPLLYLGAALGGIGVGCVYGTCVGNALKWFPDRRGLAAGITAAGFGVGSAFTIIPIQNIIHSAGYEAAFLWFGLGQGLIILALAPLLRTAPHDMPVTTAVIQTRHSHSPAETLRSPVFWVLYLMMALVSAGGLMATAQLAPIAHEFNVAGVPVSLLGLTLPALTFALSIDRILNGVTRPPFGWISDRIGRENTMFIAFSLEAVGILALGAFGHDPLLFVLLGGVVFFAWGEIYSLFPSTCTDCYGPKYATTNAGLLYTAKGVAGLLVPIGSLLVAETGNWHILFTAAAAMNALAAVLAIVVLRPMRLALAAGPVPIAAQ
jgi:MFS transporter, OFA family, oxalate/formate antiporter